MTTPAPSSFFVRHEFLIRRLHSLSGLIPVGAYMVVHLLTNSLTAMGTEPFQNAVYQIHSLGPALPIVEWGFIFLPILFHAIVGVVIILSGKSNVTHYGYGANWRYTMQRITGMIAIVFIFGHVFHLHGWFHFDAWLEGIVKPLGGGRFSPYNATSSLAAAMQSSFVIPVLYAIGILSCIFHLFNGLWTMGITWGVWVSPAAQVRAGWICLAGGLGLTAISAVALFSPLRIDPEESESRENEMYEQRVEGGLVLPDEHKRSGHESPSN